MRIHGEVHHEVRWWGWKIGGGRSAVAGGISEEDEVAPLGVGGGALKVA
jgi:hypothetical protein